MLNKFSSQLLHSADGKLYFKLSLANFTISEPLPDEIDRNNPALVQLYLEGIVPGMMEKLKGLLKDQSKRVKRKERNESKKPRRHVNGYNSLANGGKPPPSDGTN